jgi:biopolymer transport protein ExbD
VDGLSLAQVVEGLQDGKWEPTDEVMGPGESQWLPIESHPQLAELAADLEPPQRQEPEDESRIDMNALIDVCLVLLIFFMITTTYAALQKRMDAPDLSKKGPESKMRKITKEEVKNQMVTVNVKMEGGKPVIYVEDKPVQLENLESTLRQFVRNTARTQLCLSYDDKVPHGTVVAIQDAAKEARLDQVLMVVP